MTSIQHISHVITETGQHAIQHVLTPVIQLASRKHGINEYQRTGIAQFAAILGQQAPHYLGLNCDGQYRHIQRQRHASMTKLTAVVAQILAGGLVYPFV
ncbi:hypothetical protein FKF78_15175 [Aeromonas hydrophila]|nr:hypothetical protein [Aeromonas hydrophila]